ncbi:hypothetical protein [Coralliovum pocilloporae]|uniref:hypothetical protein n=1 Tax=Coralliovum pocilloporae TaxID=3066369 RepID=UPI0033072A20
MTSFILALDFLETVIKIVSIIAGVFGAIVLTSPDRLPTYIRNRPGFYWPIAVVIFVFAGISFFSVYTQIADFFRSPQQSQEVAVKDQKQTPLLPEISIPEIEPLPEQKGSVESKTSLSIADIVLGTPIDVAIQILLSRDEGCSEIEVIDPALRTKQVPAIYKLDHVFQKPRVVECFRSQHEYDHFYIYPDIYESDSKVFAIARYTSFDKLRMEDIRELLERRYGPSGDPYYQPNYGEGLYWAAHSGKLTEGFIRQNKNCFLYLPRAMESRLTNHPAALRTRQDVPIVHLSSYELKGDCGIVLHGFTLKDGPRLWLFLVNSTRVQAYKKYGNSLAEKDRIEQLNKARKNIEF